MGRPDIRLNEGLIEAKGTHEQLMLGTGLYTRLHNMQ